MAPLQKTGEAGSKVAAFFLTAHFCSHKGLTAPASTAVSGVLARSWTCGVTAGKGSGRILVVLLALLRPVQERFRW